MTKVKFLKVGREGDDTLIYDVSPWGCKWEVASSSAFVDGSGRYYPRKAPHTRAYSITVNGKTVGFWAGKLEEGVWAFYVNAREPGFWR